MTEPRKTLDEILHMGEAARTTLAIASAALTTFGGMAGGYWLRGLRDSERRAMEANERSNADDRPPSSDGQFPHHLLISASGTTEQLASALLALSLGLRLGSKTAFWEDEELGSGEMDLLRSDSHQRISNGAVIRASALGMLDVFDGEQTDGAESALRMEGEGVAGL